MPKKKSKKNKSKYEEDDIPQNDICNVCRDWTSPVCRNDPGAACEDCPHAYHDRCIDKQFRNKDFENCEQLGKDCDNESAPIFFELGPEIAHIAQKKVTHKKGRSRRAPKKPKRKKSKIGGIHKKTYKSFKYCHIEYKIGDDVAIELEDQGTQIGRIKEIYVAGGNPKPQLEVLWFWRGCEVEKDINYTEDDTIESHELYLSDDFGQTDINVDTLTNDNKSSKALVVPSSEEYFRELNNKENKDKYCNIFWCTHSYNEHSKRKALLPIGAITSHQTVGITPSKNKNKRSRKRDRKTIILNALNDAGKALMLSSVPQKLPCREKEHDEILKYMKNNILSQGQGSGLYISGMPGTGKTATVRQISNELQKLTLKKSRGGLSRGRRNKKKDKLPGFEFHEINAMKLPTPQHIYSELAKKLLGKHFAPNTAVKKLTKHFSTKDKNRKICVLLVDELDYLLTRQQKVIYNLFDWPTKLNGKLVVIGIANTMDLPERLLPRVSSRMGTARVVFKPYQRFQLTQIIEHRLDSTKVFHKDAIRFCASAVAGVSGDCRTALQICRRAVEIAQKDIIENGLTKENNKSNNKRAKTHNNNNNKNNNIGLDGDEGTEIVTLHHLKSAKYAFEQSNDIQIVSSLSIYEKLFLTAIVMYNSRSGGFAGTTIAYRQKFDNFIQTRLGDSKLNSVHFRNMVDRLEDMGIIKVTFEKKDWKEFITFNIKNEEAAHALKENDICAKVLSELQTV